MLTAGNMSDTPVSKLTELFGVKHPVIQAPMAGVSTPALAAAVSNAGGLGCVPLGALTVDAAAEALQEAFALTDGPIVANLFVHQTPRSDPQITAAFLAGIGPAFECAGAKAPECLNEIYRSFNDDDDMLQMLLDLKPAAVSLHFGAAQASHMCALKGAGIKVLATATSISEALLLEQLGVDLLVMQSYGAGGHSGAFLAPPDVSTAGRSGLMKLLEETVAAVDLPVVAAGGLMTGGDVAEVMSVGAVAAQMGTAFVGCPESLASARYRELLASGAPTRMTSNISGRPARMLLNELLIWAEGLAVTPPEYPLCYDAVKQLVAAKRNADFSVMWAGEAAINSRFLPARELLETLILELAEATGE